MPLDGLFKIVKFLISLALPLQHAPRQLGNSEFVDESLVVYTDQWVYLASLSRVRTNRIYECLEQIDKPKNNKEPELKPWEKWRQLSFVIKPNWLTSFFVSCFLCGHMPPVHNVQSHKFTPTEKGDWIFKVSQPALEFMKQDVAAYMKYYNFDRLHTANGGVSLIYFESSQNEVSGWS